MSVAVLCVPQWQGSGATDPRILADGAHATAALVPDARCVTVPLRDDTSETRDGVRSLAVIADNLARTREALATLDGSLVITTGGDCGVELAPIATARSRYGDELTVVWCDAHPDLNSPDTSPSGFIHGMVLRTLLGDGPAALVPAEPLKPEQVVLAGVRATDPAEDAFLVSSRIRRVGVADLATLATLRGPVYIHIDLDVLDPQVFRSISYQEADGPSPAELRAALAGLVANTTVVGIGITEHAPSGAEADLEALRGIVEALLPRS